ncbi:MAG: DUF58 domain-containing protein [Gammaproteobacteria bacterium]|nr:DUF58 domain-containing protein [Gammaproteobacteria bacterium]
MLRRRLFRNFRRVYRLSRWFARRLTAAGRAFGAAFIGAAVFGIDTRQTLAFQIAALLAALLAVAAGAGLWYRPRLTLRRRLPHFVTAGTPCHYTLYVRNDGRRLEQDLVLVEQLVTPFPEYDTFAQIRERAVGGRNWFDRFVGYPRWLDLVRTRRGADIDRAVLPPLPAREELAVEMALLPVRRGYVHFEATWVLRPDPLGLVNACVRHAGPETLLVLPRRYAAPPVRHPGRRRYQPGGEALASSVGESQEFAGLREYRPGDPMRHIHWRSWARLGKPVVKEFHDEFFDRNALVLDTFAPSGGVCFEEAVSLAASFACADWGPDALLDLLFVGPAAERYTAGRGLAATADMLEVLACVEPCANEPFNRLSGLVLAHAAQISSVVMVLLGWDGPRRQLVQSLRALRIAPLVLVVHEPGADPRQDPGPLADCPDRLLGVTPGDAQRVLAGMRGPQYAP